ncbi:MAG: hypothetical protein PHC34_12505 [Candidatus Gastranaerophilales bacterium]|nr:hypothetical protein [Candidatus Gastranaerophilales bacterium]
MKENQINYDLNNSEIISNKILALFPELKDFEIKVEFSDELKEKISDYKVAHNDNNDVFDIPVYQFLGEYFPDSKLIKIYLLGLKVASDHANSARDFQILLKIVLYHEIGHYWFYNYSGLPKECNNILVDLSVSEDNSQLNACFIHEWIAQLFAYICLDTDEERTFMRNFANKQPSEYRTFKDELDYSDINLILKNVSKLLHLSEVFERILKPKPISDWNIVDTIQDILNDKALNLSIIDQVIPANADYEKINDFAKIKNDADMYML